MKNYFHVLMALLCLQSFLFVEATVAADQYHKVSLEITTGIDLYGLTPGELMMQEGDHLHLQFLPEDRTIPASEVSLLIDGVETTYKNFGGNQYFSYILNSVKKDCKIKIALSENIVTLPEVEGARMMPSAGKHAVCYGESFRFSVLPDHAVYTGDMKVYANGVELKQDMESPSILIYPAPLNYIIENVTEPVKITVEGIVAHLNTEITTISLPEVEGARMMPSAGEHKVALGESFRFSLLPDPEVGTQNVKVYANGVELSQDLEGPSILIYPAPLNYVIEDVTGPVAITVEGIVAPLKNDANMATITLPKVDGVRMMPSVGEHKVALGESFRFSLLPDFEVGTQNVKVYANGIELAQDMEGPSLMIYPEPLNYVIEDITGPVVITVEGLVAHMSISKTTSVTLPEVDGARMMPFAGEHEVAVGESFRFSLLPDPEVGTENVKVYANGVELKQDLESPSILIYPAPLNYMIEEVTEPVIITVEGFVAHMNTTSNALLDEDNIQINVNNGQLNVYSAETINVTIYNIRGQLIKKCNVTGSEQISLQSGIYVVRAGKKVEKVIIP